MASALNEPFDDVQETLDAAFALIDACIPSPRELSTSSSDSKQFVTWSSSVAPQQPAATAKELQPEGRRAREKKNNPKIGSGSNRTGQIQKTHQYRQKEAILRLRGEVLVLETQLNALQALTKQLGSAHSGNTSDQRRPIAPKSGDQMTLKRPGYPKDTASLWRNVAVRQKKLRASSEAENTRLRSMLAEQRKTVQAIKRLIIRETERQIFPRHQLILDSQLLGMDNPVMGHLYEELNEIYQGVDTTLLRHGLSGTSDTPIEHRFVRLSATKYSALVMQSRILPFSYKRAANAMWEYALGFCSGGNDNYCVKSSVVVGDAFFRSYAIESSKHGEFAFAGEHAMRKYVEDTRIVFVNNGRGYPCVVRALEVDGIVSREVGRVVVTPVSDQLDTHTPVCCMQSCMEITADIDPDSKGPSSRALEFLQAHVVHKVDAFDKFSGILESILLRESTPRLRV